MVLLGIVDLELDLKWMPSKPSPGARWESSTLSSHTVSAGKTSQSGHGMVNMLVILKGMVNYKSKGVALRFVCTVFLLNNDNINCTAKCRWINGVPCLGHWTPNTPDILHILRQQQVFVIVEKAVVIIHGLSTLQQDNSWVTGKASRLFVNYISNMWIRARLCEKNHR